MGGDLDIGIARDWLIATGFKHWAGASAPLRRWDFLAFDRKRVDKDWFSTRVGRGNDHAQIGMGLVDHSSGKTEAYTLSIAAASAGKGKQRVADVQIHCAASLSKIGCARSWATRWQHLCINIRNDSPRRHGGRQDELIQRERLLDRENAAHTWRAGRRAAWLEILSQIKGTTTILGVEHITSCRTRGYGSRAPTTSSAKRRG